MDPFKGIHFKISSSGEALDLYNDPDDEPSHDPRVRQRYIEAVTGATFQVEVGLNYGFETYALNRHDGVAVHIHYDDHHSYSHHFTIGSFLDASKAGRRITYTFSRIYNFYAKTQQWKEGPATFGALAIKETSGSVVFGADIKRLGSIEVIFQRVHLRPRVTTGPVAGTPKNALEVSEKLLKGKAVANTVCATREVPSTGPSHCEYKSTPMYGEDGKPLKYKIFYRSRQALQMLGCIPRTPSLSASPEPESSTHDPNYKREQEMRALRARLADLEQANTKVEGSNSKPRIKRELGDSDDIQITASRSKRPRNSGPIETIDLTND